MKSEFVFLRVSLKRSQCSVGKDTRGHWYLSRRQRVKSVSHRFAIERLSYYNRTPSSLSTIRLLFFKWWLISVLLNHVGKRSTEIPIRQSLSYESFVPCESTLDRNDTKGHDITSLLHLPLLMTLFSSYFSYSARIVTFNSEGKCNVGRNVSFDEEW